MFIGEMARRHCAGVCSRHLSHLAGGNAENFVSGVFYIVSAVIAAVSSAKISIEAKRYHKALALEMGENHLEKCR